MSKAFQDAAILWVAQGFGSGRLRPAPGTWGSLVGLVLTYLLWLTRSPALYLTGAFLGAAASVWFCGRAEQILRATDPPSVVLDEIVALPWCFVFLLFNGAMTTTPGWLAGCLVFAAFRFFDIAKPWPVRQSQQLAGGWGVTVDDLLAAVYVNLLGMLVSAGQHWL